MSLFISSLLTLSPSGNIQHYSTDEITPAEFQNLINNQNNNLISYLLLSIHDANTDERYYIDYGRLVTDYAEPANADTWSEVINLLETNDEYKMGHRWNHMSARDVIPYSDVTIWDCIHTLNTFSINYGDSETGNYGEYLNRFHMKDLRISIVSEAETIPDLTKSIPVVNGFICKPVCVTGDAAHSTGNVIFAKYGAQLCWQNGIHRTPEVQLLDFSDLGDIEIRPFNFDQSAEDKIIFSGKTGEFTTNKRWLFKTTLDLNEYTPIVIFCGIPVFPDRIVRETNHVFSLDIFKIPLNYALPYRKYLTNDPVGAGVVYNSEELASWYKNGTIADLSFIIYVKCGRIYTVREHMDVWGNYITVNNYTPDGILISNVTDTIATYHKNVYDDRLELTLQNQEYLYITDNIFTKNHMLFLPTDCKHHKSKNLRESSCSMIYLLRGIY